MLIPTLLASALLAAAPSNTTPALICGFLPHSANSEKVWGGELFSEANRNVIGVYSPSVDLSAKGANCKGEASFDPMIGETFVEMSLDGVSTNHEALKADSLQDLGNKIVSMDSQVGYVVGSLRNSDGYCVCYLFAPGDIE